LFAALEALRTREIEVGESKSRFLTAASRRFGMTGFDFNHKDFIF